MKILLKKIYSYLVSRISYINQRKTKTKGIAYLLSFPNNDAGLLARLQEEFKQEGLFIVYTKECLGEAEEFAKQGIPIMSLNRPFSFFFKIVPWLTRTKVIICDNYFPFLGDLILNEETNVYQIWHANGAIKTFGFKDKKTAMRSSSEKARFQRVYQQFKQILIPSDKMAEIFEESYGLGDSHMLRIGLPRTDFYFDVKSQAELQERFNKSFPEAENKKVVLYVPTYRDDGQLDLPDLTEVVRELGSEYLLLCKFHPHTPIPAQAETMALTNLRGFKLNELLPQVSVLVTDYSSVPFEFSLANPQGKVIFHTPDLKSYDAKTGLQPYFKTWLNQHGTGNTGELIKKIKTNQGLPCIEINKTWNTYNDGHATTRFLEEINHHLGS